MQRNGWKRRGDMFTEYGVSIRCVRKDQSGTMIVLHYLSDGTVKLMFSYKRVLYFVPLMLILKALVNESDYDIYNQLIKGKEEDTFYRGCIAKMLRQMSCAEGIVFRDQALNFLGEKFSVKFGLPSWYSSIDVAKYLLEQCICIHLETPREKFDLLVFMVKKLFAVVKNECALESPDNPMNQEVLLPGHLYLLVLKEKLYAWQLSLRFTLERKMKAAKTMTITQSIFRDCLAKTTDVTRAVENVFSTGNFLPRYENGLTQFSGLAIVGDKLNFWRYLSHFRAVHRGAFFAEMRTTTVRKLLPEAWGFLCPVHTPDGSPCGLLNHMCSTAQVVNIQPDTSQLYNLFCKYGMLTYDDPSACGYVVILDGKVIGWVYEKKAFSFVKTLRNLKSLGLESVPKTLEICLVPQTEHSSQYPGIFAFTTPARMIRPVLNLETGVTEFIGSMEQVYLHVALDSSGIVDGVTLHQELDKHGFLSVLANQIPYSDFNQSPRNMYECQMGKQTMGTPCHALRYRSDNKLYQILIPQAPIVRPTMHDYYHMDDYPMGTNAVVAVISYSGFDMEDAIVLNKSSVERGFKHGCIFKTEIINLRVIAGDRGLQKTLVFGRKKEDKEKYPFIDEDGLPYVGTRLGRGDPICCYIDASSGNSITVKYKSLEMAYIHDVRLLGNDTGTETNQQISITYRIPRNPIIGDKFASRHGQKGICSIMLPREDMPFTEGGMTPDILFNPHGFPSRMTIGMMIESMAGKAAAMKGTLYDASPFTFSESKSAVNYFGECLKDAGFDYYGTERMYSGVSGEELEADIFFGVVYYQRLRHMVADKYQVRTTGPVDSLTRQPVKGRKREGGVRFGEMERDSLIAHGTDLLIHDRLFNCSDGCQQYVCSKCKNLLSPLAEKKNQLPSNNIELFPNEWKCKVCNSGEYITTIDIPYVFRYLCAELAAVNFKVTLKIGDYQ
ncbi:DNA-directed RNA polymerase I subunit RPA2-like [Uloborus diversus]|uniref:DNA-directed RNA polymerase I subunit RPA2-like n=1 Tax=Uloborus diversus TaxID=327109 RepID=UPI002408F50F|nr:DNA-directed RNA polymerase I subunit RPA2-like [Uloborus diversus]